MDGIPDFAEGRDIYGQGLQAKEGGHYISIIAWGRIASEWRNPSVNGGAPGRLAVGRNRAGAHALFAFHQPLPGAVRASMVELFLLDAA